MGETPPVLGKALGMFNPVVREVVNMSCESEEPFIVSHEKFERAFGACSTPLEEAIKTTVDWFRQNPGRHG